MKITINQRIINLFSIIVIVLLVSCQKRNSPLIGSNQEITIEGELSYFVDKEFQVVVEYTDLVSNEIIKHVSQSVKGNFKFRLFKYNVQDIHLIIGEEVVPLLVVPGKNISLKITTINNELSVKFAGSNSDFQTDFNDLYNSLSDFKTTLDASSRLSSLSHEKHKNYALHNEKRLLEYIGKYQKANSISKMIIDWFEMSVKYETANSLMYPYNVKSDLDGVTSDYWDFIGNYPISNYNAITCSEYHTYCNNYFLYLSNIEGKFSEALKAYGNNWEQYYLTTIDTLSNTISGIAADILIANLSCRFMKDDMDAFNSLADRVYSKIENENIRNLTSDKYTSLVQNIEDMSMSNDIRIYDYRRDTIKADILDILLNRYKNKVVYIDNWASWCGPCIAEMPYSLELQKRFIDENIVFVFLCNPDNYLNDRAELIISENQLKGEHYFMNYYQSGLMHDRFVSKGFPRYMIIDKQGKVVNNDAPRPSSVRAYELLSTLL